ncbi:MAG TPA: hypothetical protein VHZ74_23595 [Bryobacteraceae bacterium]|nr:hypothetical protein [Bryobacteraceae bacterium]
MAAELNSGFANDDAAILSIEKAMLRLVDAKLPGNRQPTETYARGSIQGILRSPESARRHDGSGCR